MQFERFERSPCRDILHDEKDRICDQVVVLACPFEGQVPVKDRTIYLSGLPFGKIRASNFKDHCWFEIGAQR